MQLTTSILLEIPEPICDRVNQYIAKHPDWDQDRVFTAAIAMFLLQDGNLPEPAKTEIGRVYLNAQFAPTHN